MSTVLQGLPSDMQPAPTGRICEESHYVMVRTIANQLALDDDERANIIAQREADLEEAEWILGVVRAAGYVLVPGPR